MSIEPELVVDCQCALGEGPLWHPIERRLYWTDITSGRLLRYDPASGAHEVCYEGETVGGFTIQADGALLLFMARGAVKRWCERKLTTVIEDIPGERDSRFNDVIADPAGRVFCGTMPVGGRPGRLYRLDLGGALSLVLDDAGVSNGMGFTPDRRQFFHTDSIKRTITRFSYDEATGALGEPRLFARVPAGEGVPDGMTVDAEGFVWSARWDGGRAVRYGPDGGEVLRVPFPARRVTSVTFGGEEYADLYVTTAGGDDRATYGPGAGALFRLQPGVRGLPEFLSRVGL
ncbi:MAG: SMP-30/gluconolactonase/LRE family protein [Anaerolineae bacterium]|nr:SMP-30/gluconolactonase/LRE family protein [Anaerolineae bacterium]